MSSDAVPGQIQKRLTLTFDNGPDRDVTPRVLDELARRDLKATFFVLGKNMEDPELWNLAERAHAEGHWIGNHTFNHEVPLGEQSQAGAAQLEIGATQDLIGTLSHPDKFFRPFGGGGILDQRLLNAEAREYLVANGYTCVLWNSIPRDWEDPDGWVDTAIEQMKQNPWTVVVLHDLATGAMANLEAFLDQVADRDIQVVQDFSDECVALRRGHATPLLDEVLSGTPE